MKISSVLAFLVLSFSPCVFPNFVDAQIVPISRSSTIQYFFEGSPSESDQISSTGFADFNEVFSCCGVNPSSAPPASQNSSVSSSQVDVSASVSPFDIGGNHQASSTFEFVFDVVRDTDFTLSGSVVQLHNAFSVSGVAEVSLTGPSFDFRSPTVDQSLDITQLQTSGFNETGVLLPGRYELNASASSFSTMGGVVFAPPASLGFSFTASVPEPSGFPILLMGGAFVISKRRKVQQQGRSQ